MEATARSAGATAASAPALTVARRDRLRALWTEWRPSVLAGVIGFALFRAVTEVAGLVSLYGAGTLGVVAHSPGVLLRMWYVWDGEWYLRIISNGYVKSSHVLIPGAGVQDASAFAPFFPALGRGVVDVLHVAPGEAASMVVAVSLLVGLVVAHKLASLDLGRRGAHLFLLVLLAYPASFFLGAVYAEATLLALLSCCLLAARSRHWWLAGGFAALAVLAKTYLVILIVPLAIECAEASGWSLRRVRWKAVPLVTGPSLALALLMAYMQYRFHDPVHFVRVEALWQHHLSPPWVAIGNSLHDLVVPGATFSARVLSAFDIGSVFVLCAAGIYAWFRLRRSYGAYMLCSVAVFVSTGILRSTGRYVLMAIPLFILAVLLLRARPRLLALAATLSGLAGLFFVHEYVNWHFAG